MKVVRPGILNTAQPFYEQTGIHSPLWCIGCVDCYGAIHARHATQSENILHGPNESKGKRWRFNILAQKFVMTALNDEEMLLVIDWLERKGYKRPYD